MLSRIAQFADIMLDAKPQIDKVTYIVQSHHVEHEQGCPVILPCVCVFPKGDAQRARANIVQKAYRYAEYMQALGPGVLHVIDLCSEAMSQPGLQIERISRPATLRSPNLTMSCFPMAAGVVPPGNSGGPEHDGARRRAPLPAVLLRRHALAHPGPDRGPLLAPPCPVSCRPQPPA